MSLLLLDDLHLSLGTHNTTTPLLADVLVLLQVSILDGRNKLGQLSLVLRADLGNCKDSSSL